MRTSNLLLATLKEVPTDAEIVSHKLMLRAGLIRRLASGLFTWMPLGLRVLRKSPGFATVAILTLALGIGATTVLFTLLHSVILSPLPFDEADRLVALGHAAPERGIDDAGQCAGCRSSDFGRSIW